MSNLKIAVQKSGRLNTESLKLIESCGIFPKHAKDQLKVKALNFPLEILYLRNSDILQYVEDGIVDIGIVGQNVLIEQAKNIEIVKHLGFSKCRLSLAVPKHIQTNDISYFEGKKIATSYPNTLKTYLDKNNIKAEIHYISGSVEIAPNIGLADGICDIVSSGNTLFQNGLREIKVILNSEAVLVKSNSLNKNKQEILAKLLFRFNAVLNSKNSKYVLLNVPNENISKVSAILPVLKSPTILPLQQEGWSSLHSVIDENKFWDVIDELKLAGAEDILIVPIDKMVL